MPTINEKSAPESALSKHCEINVGPDKWSAIADAWRPRAPVNAKGSSTPLRLALCLLFAPAIAAQAQGTNFALSGQTVLSLVSGSYGTGALQFWPSVGSLTTTGSTSMSLLSDGSVGIGTDKTSGYKLAVDGGVGQCAIHARDVMVDPNPWSDYVFADGYRNAPLSEVEAQIKSQHHLPGVPSAKDMVEKGVNLAQMDAILLGKVEELTLHLIEHEKTIKAQAERIEKLQSKNRQARSP